MRDAAGTEFLAKLAEIAEGDAQEERGLLWVR
jgi:hypothetical protein